MIVAERLNGATPVLQNPRSRTMAYEPNAAAIRQMRSAAGSNLEMTRLRGLGDGMGSVPSWVPWAVGGLVLGVGVGYGVYRMRKGKRR